MSKWDALKCLLGFHEWTRWRATAGDYGESLMADAIPGFPPPTKRQRRFCTRCGTAETRPWQGRTRTIHPKETL